jgi:hypothetical protein
MSRYAWLVCPERGLSLWLGKVCTDDSGRRQYHIGDADALPNANRDLLNRVLWMLLAESEGSMLKVVTDRDPEYEQLDCYVEIGGDRICDLSFEAFLRDGLTATQGRTDSPGA